MGNRSINILFLLFLLFVIIVCGLFGNNNTNIQMIGYMAIIPLSCIIYKLIFLTTPSVKLIILFIFVCILCITPISIEQDWLLFAKKGLSLLMGGIMIICWTRRNVQ